MPTLARAQDPKYSTSVNVVSVLATVRDPKGKIVHDLAQDEFTLQEDGRPQTIRYFSQQSDLPLTLGLLIDTSGSQTRVLDRERNASYEFFEHILREDQDKAFLIHFDREVELLQDLTSSRKDLEAALRDVERPQLNRRSSGNGPPQGRGQGREGFGTAMYDAIFLAADEILKKQQGRKAVVLLSDGVDRNSKTSIGGAIESAQRADMLVYSIRFADDSSRSPVSFGGPGIGRGGRRGGGGGRFPQPSGGGRNGVDGKKILERISQETGGGYFEVTNKMPLDKIYDQIEEELRNQYSLGYTPDPSSGGYHKISVSVKRKGLTVRARDGYYS
ncbi:MAG: VWA domain-containing protein [Acidobacteriia bacterium]|nr:VWA domain-containing protein [Terriglobia bacterium]